MVALELVTAAGATAAMTKLARFIPVVNRDPRLDAAIKAGIGLALILVSMKVKNGYAKAALVGIGVGGISLGAAAVGV